MAPSFNSAKTWLLAAAAILLTTPTFASATPVTLQFFSGAIKAQATWLTPPSASKPSQLKIELSDKSNQPYDIDPSLIAVGLFMDSMPEMGVDQQNIVSMSDNSGSPIPGVYVATDVQFSMRGGWSVQVTIPDPRNPNKTEMQQFKIDVK